MRFTSPVGLCLTLALTPVAVTHAGPREGHVVRYDQSTSVTLVPTESQSLALALSRGVVSEEMTAQSIDGLDGRYLFPGHLQDLRFFDERRIWLVTHFSPYANGAVLVDLESKQVLHEFVGFGHKFSPDGRHVAHWGRGEGESHVIFVDGVWCYPPTTDGGDSAVVAEALIACEWTSNTVLECVIREVPHPRSSPLPVSPELAVSSTPSFIHLRFNTAVDLLTAPRETERVRLLGPDVPIQVEREVISDDQVLAVEAQIHEAAERARDLAAAPVSGETATSSLNP